MVSRSPSGSATTSTRLASCHQMRPPQLARHRNALRSGPAPLKSPSRKFTPQPPPELRVGRTAAVLPAPRPHAVRHWPQRLARSAFTRANWAPCWEGRVADALPPPCATLPAARRFPRSVSGRARCGLLLPVFGLVSVRPGAPGLPSVRAWPHGRGPALSVPGGARPRGRRGGAGGPRPAGACSGTHVGAPPGWSVGSGESFSSRRRSLAPGLV